MARMVTARDDLFAQNDSSAPCHERKKSDKKVGYHGTGHDVIVAGCDASEEIAVVTRKPQSAEGVAACVPPLYARDLDAHFRMVNTFMTTHRALGIDRFFIYTCDAASANHSSLQQSDTTLILTTFCATSRMTMRGQNWMINDCIHRAAAANVEWVLSCDIDERLAFHPTLGLRELLNSDAARTADVLTLGSKQVWRWPNGTIKNTLLHCFGGSPRKDPRLCIGFYGHRKHFTRAQHVWLANLHFVAVGTYVRRCRDGLAERKCNIVDVRANESWLFHEKFSYSDGMASTGSWTDDLNAWMRENSSSVGD